jgi:CrcB protein
VSEPAAPQAHRRAARVLRERWDILLVIAAGGALGSLARWGLSVTVPVATGAAPWVATGIENVTGGLLLGALMVLILEVWPPNRYLRPFVAVGILGGFTTFSTYMLDAFTLLAAGSVPVAFGYLLGTLLAGLFAVWSGIVVTRAAIRVVARHHRRKHKEAV